MNLFHFDDSFNVFFTTSNNSGFPNTKLNFSDISLGSQSHASLAGVDDSNASRLMGQYSMSKANTSSGRLGVFNAALDIEKRVRVIQTG